MTARQVPTLDIRLFDDTATRSAFVAELGAAYREYGFCGIAGHGIPDALVDEAYTAFRQLEQQDDLSDAEATITTNLLGPIRLTAALLPLLQKHTQSAILNVTSGLAYVPLAAAPTYCATKAALRSYTLSLRYQLRNTPTEVIEIAPPYVQTDLMDGAEDPRAMPLADYIAETMSLLTAQPTPTEVCVKNVHGLRFAEKEGRFEATFQGFNEAMESHL